MANADECCTLTARPQRERKYRDRRAKECRNIKSRAWDEKGKRPQGRAYEGGKHLTICEARSVAYRGVRNGTYTIRTLSLMRTSGAGHAESSPAKVSGGGM